MATTSAVYIHVIEDVISKVRDDFIQAGADESNLTQLQALWEMKMVHCGAVCPTQRDSIPKQTVAGGGPLTHDLNVPYEGTEEYETPTTDLLFPPTPLQTPLPQTPLPQTPFPQTPLAGPVDNSMYQNVATPSELSGPASGAATDLKPGRPSPYMQPPSPWISQRPLGVDVNVAYEEGRNEVDRSTPNQNQIQDFFVASSGKRKGDELPNQLPKRGSLPQQDGAADATFEVSFGSSSFSRHSLGSSKLDKVLAKVMGTSPGIPQQDGPAADNYDDLYPYQGVATEDYNAVTPAGHDVQAGTPIVAGKDDGGDDDDDEPPLNENDDDDDLDGIDEEGEDQNTAHLVLAQFDKVTRTKSRWKCQLKDGIMHINNKDILFTKANGEFDF
ncbi:transcription initiation factor IIA large subunit-like [Papaver somniferum]|uniref:transcription initiation factor IIA large subunit-like n=1 Tax=Papaver somniferum TaxID=3469 RepID=UPI000E6F9082|nr:transcription initiation factor IIA large subunit-like [Papaver somniferum]